MPCLADSSVCRKFVKMLEQCEKDSRWLDSWEQRFVADMREWFNIREDQIDLGVPQWNPTTNQWNTLHTIYHKVS